MRGTRDPQESPLSSSHERRGRASSLVPSPHWVSLGLLGALTLMTLALVIVAAALTHRSADPVVLLRAMSDIGLGVLDDASWLFPSLIATLLVVAVIPRSAQAWPDASSEPATTTTSVVLAAAPAAVGVLATTSIVLVILGVAARPAYATDLLAPLSLFAVIVGLSHAITYDLAARPSYRVRMLRQIVASASQAAAQTHKVVARDAGIPRPRLVWGAALTIILGSLLACLTLWGELALRGQRIDILSVATFLPWLAGLSAVATGVLALSAYLWWISPRRWTDVCLVLYFEGGLVTLFGLLLVAVNGAGGPSGALVVPTLFVPLVSVRWTRLTSSKWLEWWRLRVPLATRALVATRDRTIFALEELEGVSPKTPPADEDALFLEVLMRVQRARRD